MVSAKNIDPQEKKIKAIQDWPVPKCVHDVRAFFGLASYYRKFVQNFASIAEQLSALTKKGVCFSSTPKAQQAFDRLKRALAETVTLAYPQRKQIFILDTDASDVAVGAILSTTVDGVERPIAFFSRVMNSAQRNYCPTRRELFAVIAGLQHFRHYCVGARVVLRTDHYCLKCGLSSAPRASWHGGSKGWLNLTTLWNTDPVGYIQKQLVCPGPFVNSAMIGQLTSLGSLKWKGRMPQSAPGQFTCWRSPRN